MDNEELTNMCVFAEKHISRRGCIVVCAGALAAAFAGCSSSQDAQDGISSLVSASEPKSREGIWSKVRQISYEDGKIYVTEYENDDSGKVVHERKYLINTLLPEQREMLLSLDNGDDWLESLDVDMARSVDHTYDSNGNELTYLAVSYLNGKPIARAASEFSYDDHGNIVERQDEAGLDDNKGFDRDAYEYEYYDNGSKASVHAMLDIEQNPHDQYEYYDEDGNQTHFESWLSDGSLDYQIDSEFDDQGNQLSSYCTDEQGAISTRQTSFEIDYDDAGRIVEKRFLGDKPATYTYQYSDGEYLHVETITSASGGTYCKYTVSDSCGNVIAVWDGESRSMWASGFGSDGKRLDERLINESSNVDERRCWFYDRHGNDIVMSSSTSLGFNVYTCIFVNSLSHGISIGSDLFDLIDSDLIVSSTSYRELDASSADLLHDCRGLWCSGRRVMVLMDNGKVEAVMPSSDGDPSIAFGNWEASGDAISIAFDSLPITYSLECNDQCETNFIGAMSAERMYRVSSEFVKKEG